MKYQFLVYLITYGGAVVAFISPFHGVLAYIALGLLKPEKLWMYSVEPWNYVRLVAIAVLVAWLMHGMGTWHLGRARAVIWSLIAFLVWSFVCFAFADQHVVAWESVVAMAKLVVPLLVGFTLIDTVKKLKLLAWTIILCTTCIAFEAHWEYYFTYRGGNFVHTDRNLLSLSMAMVAALAFLNGLHAKSWLQAIPLFLCAALMVHVVLFSQSRGGMLMVLIIGGVLFALIEKRPKYIVWLVIAAAVGLRLAGPQIRARFATTFAEDKTRDASAESRLQLWGHAVDTMITHPIVGVGPGSWVRHSTTYGWSKGKNAHTLWLETGAEMGFPGLVLLLGVYVFNIRKLWPIARRKIPVDDEWLVVAARMAVASLTGFMVGAQFVSVITVETPYYVALLGAGTLKLVSAYEMETLESNTVGVSNSPRLRAIHRQPA